MKITIDITPCVRSIGGISRFAGELSCALNRSSLKNEDIALFINDSLNSSLPPPLNILPVTELAIPNKLWRLSVILAHIIRAPQDSLVGSPDIFIATDHLLPFFSRARSIFVVHDLTFRLFPKVHMPLNRWFLRIMLPLFLKQADTIIAVSEATRKDLIKYYPTATGKTHVIKEGVSTHFQHVKDSLTIESVKKKYKLPDKFFLFLGTIEPRKNIPMLLNAFKHVQAHIPGMPLVIVGKKGWRKKSIFKLIHDKKGLGKNVVFINTVSENDLPAVYSLATTFVYPSRYEGFGLPVLEAMACGTPVICSNTSSLPEVTGDSAFLVPPDDMQAWKQAMIKVAKNQNLQKDMRKKGFKRSACFTWHKTAQQVLNIIHSI